MADLYARLEQEKQEARVARARLTEMTEARQRHQAAFQEALSREDNARSVYLMAVDTVEETEEEIARG